MQVQYNDTSQPITVSIILMLEGHPSYCHLMIASVTSGWTKNPVLASLMHLLIIDLHEGWKNTVFAFLFVQYIVEFLDTFRYNQ